MDDFRIALDSLNHPPLIVTVLAGDFVSLEAMNDDINKLYLCLQSLAALSNNLEVEVIIVDRLIFLNVILVIQNICQKAIFFWLQLIEKSFH